MEPDINNGSGECSVAASSRVRSSNRVRHTLSYRRMLRGEAAGNETPTPKPLSAKRAATTGTASASAAAPAAASYSTDSLSARSSSSMRSSIDNSASAAATADQLQLHDSKAALAHVGAVAAPMTTNDNDAPDEKLKTRAAALPSNSVARRPAHGERDTFCWTCHRDGGRLVACARPHCWRVFHLRCIPPMTAAASTTTTSTTLKVGGVGSSSTTGGGGELSNSGGTGTAGIGIGFDGWICNECEVRQHTHTHTTLYFTSIGVSNLLNQY